MDFREATDVLLEPFTISHLARALEVSEASVRQARLRNGKGVRQPPKGWEARLIALADRRIQALERLVWYMEGKPNLGVTGRRHPQPEPPPV